MRKVFRMLGLLSSIVALASCSIKEELQAESEMARFRGTIEQLVPDSSTRAYATFDEENGKYHVYWNTDDRISLFKETSLNREYRFVGKDGASSGYFKPVEGSQEGTIGTGDIITTGYQYAIYPHDEIMNCCDEDGVLEVYFPKKQALNSDQRGLSARLLMVGRAEEDKDVLGFKHVGSYLAVTLKGEGVSVKSISFQGNKSETLAGDPFVTFDAAGEPNFKFREVSSYNSSVVSMEFTTPVELTAEEQEFWFVVPSITLSEGYTLTVTDAHDGVFQKKTSSSVTFKRKTFYHSRATVVTTKPVTGVSLDDSEFELNVHDEKTLTATVLPEDATDQSVTWVSSDEDVATVDENGKVTAHAKGTAIITVKTNDGGFEDSCEVTVSDVVSYSLAIDPATAEINALQSMEFSVILTTVKNGVTTESPVDAPLSTDELSGIEIEGNRVKGLEGGIYTITAAYTPEGSTEITASATIKVKDVFEYSLTLDPADAEISINGTQPYTATLSTSKNGGTPTSSTVNATLTSSNNIVSIEGMTVKGLQSGTTTITASYTPDGAEAVTAEATLRVKSYSLAIEPAEDAEVNAGSTLAFSLILTTTIGEETETSDVTAAATWTSSDTAIATIADGVATGGKEGTVTITAKYTTPDGVEKTLTAPLKVNKNPNQAGDDIPIGGGGSFGGNN